MHFFFAGHLDTLLRSLIIGSLAYCADESVVAESKKRFQNHYEGKSLIPADLRGAVYRAVMTCGDEKTYDAFLKVSKGPLPLDSFSVKLVVKGAANFRKFIAIFFEDLRSTHQLNLSVHRSIS